MKLKFDVIEFGPVRNVVIELAPLTIFTGMSNLGKSYVNYLSYYLFSCLSDPQRIEGLIKKKIKTNATEVQVLQIRDIEKWMDDHVEEFMRDFLGNPDAVCKVHFHLAANDEKEAEIRISFEKRVVEFGYINNEDENHSEETIVVLFNDAPQTMFPVLNFNAGMITPTLQSYLVKKFLGARRLQTSLLPPARGSLVGESFSTKLAVTSSSGMYRYFLQDNDRAVHHRITTLRHNRFLGVPTDLLEGKLVAEREKSFLQLADNQRIPLTAASSSVRELSTLLFLVENRLRKIGFTSDICIEEPEAHLHPALQIKMADLIARICSLGSFVQLTTHSDYFLQRINQIVRLAGIKKTDSERFEELSKDKLLDAMPLLDGDKILVYYFHRDGNGQVAVDKMTAGKQGFPFRSFFDVVEQMASIDDRLSEVEDY